ALSQICIVTTVLYKVLRGQAPERRSRVGGMRPVYRPFSRISEFGCREYKHLQCTYEPTIRYSNFKSAFFDLADSQTNKNQLDLPL
ncbi:MAG: hypothetical protein IKH55_09515, partial [Fibrobacter sp.]|nr:hypothetical protein [Fibrobacter sp.]